MNFTVVLIARNEAKTVPRLVESLAQFMSRGGEVILVDTGSSDGTPDLARGLGCRVEEVGTRFLQTITALQAFQINGKLADEPDVVHAGDTLFDYASARNFAASLSSTDMIAMPDCDEIYTALNLDIICSAIDGAIDQLEYNFVFAHDEHGAEMVKFMHSKFYNRSRLFWKGIIHEVLQTVSPDISINRHFFDESIIKLEHWQNEETNRGGYLKGLALSTLLDPEDDRNSHYYGRELLYTNRPRSAIKELRRHVAMGKWAEERSQSLVHIGDAQLQLGENQKAIHTWIDAFDVCPTRREPLMRIADFYYKSNCPDHAIVYTQAAQQIPESNFYAAYRPFYTNYPHEILYWAYEKKGDMDRAREHFDIAWQLQRYNPKYMQDLARFYDLPKISIIMPTLRTEGAVRTTDSIHKLNYPKDKIEFIPIVDSPRIGVPLRVAEGFQRASGEWIVYAADDMEFDPDCLLAAYTARQEHKMRLLISFNAGPLTPDLGNICEHFMIHRSGVDRIGGEIFDTQFHHIGVDNLLWAKMEKLGAGYRCEQAKIIHHHFSTTGVMDEVHKLAWNEEDVAYDRNLLKHKLAELENGS